MTETPSRSAMVTGAAGGMGRTITRAWRKTGRSDYSGTLMPGQRLVERELCQMTAVSRPSIREALRLLEADGLVTTVPHRGPVVSTIRGQRDLARNSKWGPRPRRTAASIT